jgi:hypothetical protein
VVRLKKLDERSFLLHNNPVLVSVTAPLTYQSVIAVFLSFAAACFIYLDCLMFASFGRCCQSYGYYYPCQRSYQPYSHQYLMVLFDYNCEDSMWMIPMMTLLRNYHYWSHHLLCILPKSTRIHYNICFYAHQQFYRRIHHCPETMGRNMNMRNLSYLVP